jgi:hypothetical protein
MLERNNIQAWFGKFLATVRVHKQPTGACESVSDEVKQIYHMSQRSPNLINLLSIQGTVGTTYDVSQSSAQAAASVAYKVRCPGVEARQATPTELSYCYIVSHQYESWLPSKHLIF